MNSRKSGQLFKGTLEDFRWKPVFNRVSNCYGIYWLWWGATFILTKRRTHDFLLEDNPNGWDTEIRTGDLL